jgi:DNA-directed RNA polymerase subunit RPC12/RpoP
MLASSGVDDDHEDAWPSQFAELRQLDRELRCPICGEFISTCLTLPACLHSCESTHLNPNLTMGGRRAGGGAPSPSLRHVLLTASYTPYLCRSRGAPERTNPDVEGFCIAVCAVCIRRFLQTTAAKEICPMCRVPTSSALLKPNPHLDTIVRSFSNCRSSMLTALREGTRVRFPGTYTPRVPYYPTKGEVKLTKACVAT